jgi:integrase
VIQLDSIPIPSLSFCLSFTASVKGFCRDGELRRSEVVALDVTDYNPETTELRVREGSGRKDRIAYATNGAKAALDAWLTGRGPEPGPMFWPAAGRGRALVNRRMSDQAILLVLRKRPKEARVAPFTPHDLRRTFIGDLLDAGADMAVVQRLAGHASVQTNRAVRPTRRRDQAPSRGTVARPLRAKNLTLQQLA